MNETHDPQPLLATGVSFALLAAVLFGVSTPFAKLLLGEITPMLLAGLLYLVFDEQWNRNVR